MGIYDRDYMRHGYQRPKREKNPPKRKSRISFPLVVGAVILLGIVTIFAVSLRTPYDESEHIEPIVRVIYPLDLNTAKFDELMTVPQIGPATAEQIINNHPFNQLEELLTIYGIGEPKLKVFSEYLIIVLPESGVPT